MRFRRGLKSWRVLLTAVMTAAFLVGDAAAWIGSLFGRPLSEEWVRFAVFILFGVIVFLELDKREARIEEAHQQIRLIASPARMAVNHPSPPEPPLKHDEVSIDTTIQLEVWTDIDVHTSSLVLNVVAVRPVSWRRFWRVVLPKSKRVLGIRIENQDTPAYRRQIDPANAQPFVDRVTFKWRGKRAMTDWGDGFVFELALEAGSPKGVWRARIDPRLHERGAVAPL